MAFLIVPVFFVICVLLSELKAHARGSSPVNTSPAVEEYLDEAA